MNLNHRFLYFWFMLLLSLPLSFSPISFSFNCAENILVNNCMLHLPFLMLVFKQLLWEVIVRNSRWKCPNMVFIHDFYHWKNHLSFKVRVLHLVMCWSSQPPPYVAINFWNWRVEYIYVTSEIEENWWSCKLFVSSFEVK